MEGKRVALIGHSMGGRIALQSLGPWYSCRSVIDEHQLVEVWTLLIKMQKTPFQEHHLTCTMLLFLNFFSWLQNQILLRYAADYPEDLNLLVIEDMAAW